MSKLDYLGYALMLAPIILYPQHITFQEGVLVYLLLIGIAVHGIRYDEQ